jgi:hypothetical protein
MKISRFFLQSTTSLFGTSSSSIVSKSTCIAMAPITSLDLSGTKGEFKRSDAKWRNWVKDTTTMDGTLPTLSLSANDCVL